MTLVSHSRHYRADFIGNEKKALEINSLPYVCQGLPELGLCAAGESGSIALI